MYCLYLRGKKFDKCEREFRPGNQAKLPTTHTVANFNSSNWISRTNPKKKEIFMSLGRPLSTLPFKYICRTSNTIFPMPNTVWPRVLSSILMVSVNSRVLSALCGSITRICEQISPKRLINVWERDTHTANIHHIICKRWISLFVFLVLSIWRKKWKENGLTRKHVLFSVSIVLTSMYIGFASIFFEIFHRLNFLHVLLIFSEKKRRQLFQFRPASALFLSHKSHNKHSNHLRPIFSHTLQIRFSNQTANETISLNSTWTRIKCSEYSCYQIIIIMT